ncbi:MAG: T9SS type A sorting domain-containing protein [Bacteroidales bacterium]|nr:T9SS type A sorting domain-containing protein [Bacteroidales bacterium]
MKKFTIFILFILSLLNTKAQDYLISFAGTGESSTVDSVLVENLTQGTSLTFAGTDILNLNVTVGVSELSLSMADALHIFPNPMSGNCTVGFETDFQSNTTIELYDIKGKKILQSQEILAIGFHTFNLTGIKNGIYLLKISSDIYAYSSKIICMNASVGKAEINYAGTRPEIDKQNAVKLKNTWSTINMEYTLDDYLKITGKSGVYRSVKMLKPTNSQTVTFNFIACKDADNNNYATVQIGSQVWMAENLNVGTSVNGSQAQTDNGIIEKYNYNDNSLNGDIYGGLYSWTEMMQYESSEGIQGICPNGWHIPTDLELTTLNNFLSGVPASGAKMKETGFNHWAAPNTAATNESGFSALPGGTRNSNGTFQNLGYNANFWTSVQSSSTNAWNSYLSYNQADLESGNISKETGNSCRCIQDDAIELTKLAGETTKTWKLLRDVSTGNYPLQIGPYDRSEIWWAMGLNNNELANRPCMLNDEWTFGRDGSMVFDTKGDYWAEGSIFPEGENNICASTADPMINRDGVDVSAWGDGTHEYELTTGSSPKLKVIGNGAYLGLCKVGTDYEFMVPQDSVRYDIISLYDGTTDTLIIESNYYFDYDESQYGAYWRFVLVHYDDPNDEPPIPSNPPTAGFTYSSDGLTATFTNTSLFGETFHWDFGDGATSTELNPAHTYAVDGFYAVTLIAYNSSGEDSYSQTIAITTGDLTEELLVGGAWRIPVSNHSIYVGSGMGSDNWWITPLANLDGTMVGTTDDWSCMVDDEFIFSAGGGYAYETNGGSRNDGYFGQPNGCWTDEEIAGSGYGAAFGSCNTHTFEFTPATENSRAIITLTNGPGFAAFIGFYKGYYGGENSDPFNPPNGGYPTTQYEVIAYGTSGDTEILIVSVDISNDHSGSAAWTIELER